MTVKVPVGISNAITAHQQEFQMQVNLERRCVFARTPIQLQDQTTSSYGFDSTPHARGRGHWGQVEIKTQSELDNVRHDIGIVETYLITQSQSSVNTEP
ncbi:hypothetical protein E4U57_004228 [Claviceps arundinis]|uniref:Uncharacterized protein n=1 Tax=Claviceps arundinis TaxID=1623583 RepID=A0ABQ7P5D1_9HYPO|nr:hypothetical protein E4U57_004228 [Claviceps arundinis]